MVIKFILLLSLFSTTALATNVFFGNSGEGYLIEDKVYVRDLIQWGVIEKPHFESRKNQEIGDLLAISSLARLDFDQTLLVRKLTEIETYYPQLGKILVAVANKYAWQFTGADLELSPLDLPQDSIKHNARRVALANRYQRTILLQRHLWEKMDDENKVTLILHEILYGLSKPLCWENGCDQSPESARRLVRSVMLAPNRRMAPSYLTSLFKSLLDIPQNPPVTCTAGPSYSAQIWFAPESAPTPKKSGYRLHIDSNLQKFTQDVCRELKRTKSLAFPLRLEGLVFRPTYAVAEDYYTQSGAAVQMSTQVYHQYAIQSFNLGFSYPPKLKTCKDQLKKIIKEFFVDSQLGRETHINDLCIVRGPSHPH